MHPSLLERLVCPRCAGTLDCAPLAAPADGNIMQGTLRCRGCAVSYPIDRGIPRFVAHDNYAASFGYQWNRFRQEQIDSMNGTRQSERRLRTETGWDPAWTTGKWVLDAGCGAGRFLEVASRNPEAQVVGVDISNAVDAARETVAARPNAHLVQASLFALPFRPGTFDAAYCIGVLQHTPDPPRGLEAMARVVKAGGRLAVTIYERRRFSMLYSKYWLRPLTRRMPHERLLAAIKIAMPVAFAVSEVLFRIPVLGRFFRFVIPVANYVDAKDLSMRQRYQWAILDTFDMLAPAYDHPQREGDVRAVLVQSEIDQIERLPNPGLNIIGIKRAGHAEGGAVSP